MKNATRRICITALGIALFTVFSAFLQIPVWENYTLCFGYTAMAVWCCCFGPFSGTAAGVLGVVLYCLLANGLRGMPGWALGNLVIGPVLGYAFRRTRGVRSPCLRMGMTGAAMMIKSASA